MKNCTIINIELNNNLHIYQGDIFMGYFHELWNNQPNTFIGLVLAILVLLGIYIKLLDIYR